MKMMESLKQCCYVIVCLDLTQWWGFVCIYYKQSADEYFKMEMNELPEENDVRSENYQKVPIEDFGRALLRGMGWDGKTGLDSKTYV